MDGFFKRDQLNFRSPFSLSLAVHALFLLACAALIMQRTASTPMRRTTLIELEPLPPQELLKNIRSKDQTRPDQRIVQTTKSQKADKAAPDAFLGEQTQLVDRQTVSKDKMIQMGESKTTTAKTDSPSKAQTKRPKETVAKKPVALPLQNLGLPVLPDAKEMDRLAQDKAKGRDDGNFPNLGQQAPKDYIQGLKEGESTALNTREFMFFGYYQRIRERLDRAWVPILRENLTALYKRGRTLASEMDYSTKVMVIMNRGGTITRVQVQTESGAHDLDDAAVKAFNKAGPFPNPPTGMVDNKGEIRIPWEFILRT